MLFFSYCFFFVSLIPIIYTLPFIVIAIISQQQQYSRIRIRFIVFITLIILMFDFWVQRYGDFHIPAIAILRHIIYRIYGI